MVISPEIQIHDLAVLFSRLSRLFHMATREDAICCGVTVSQCHTLLSLLEAGSTTMQVLSQRLGIAPSTLTRNIEPLVARGWVQRERAEGDRRLVVVGLSPEGRHKAAELKSVQLASCRRLLEGLPATERETVLMVMDVFLTALEREMSGGESNE